MTEAAAPAVLIGISMPDRRHLPQVMAFLRSGGIAATRLAEIDSPAQAAYLRAEGGLVVHLEPGSRPALPEHLSSTGVPVLKGDAVLVGARRPGEYLPRLLTAITGWLAHG